LCEADGGATGICFVASPADFVSRYCSGARSKDQKQFSVVPISIRLP
jgi:hypothetical protein